MFLFDVYFSCKQSIEENVGLRYVTQGFLKASENKYDPNLGQIKFSLEVLDKQWEPRSKRSKKWNPTNRTFTEVRFLIIRQKYFVLCHNSRKLISLLKQQTPNAFGGEL